MKYLFPALLIFGLIAMGCVKDNASSSQSSKPVSSATQKPVAKKVASPGEELYKANCSVCHRANGKGMPGLYPTLVKTEWVAGDNSVLINLVLAGMKGEIEVNGEKFNMPMAGYASVLDDQQVADLLTYVRKSFGNDYPAITAEQVKAERAKL